LTIDVILVGDGHGDPLSDLGVSFYRLNLMMKNVSVGYENDVDG